MTSAWPPASFPGALTRHRRRGVRVGHLTLVEGDRIRTGVTAIVPHPGNVFRDKVAGAVFVGNAFGKLAGATQVHELGTIESPIVLTNTLGVGAAIEGVVAEVLSWKDNEDVRSVNAVVGETNDGGLNDIRALRVRPVDVRAAIHAATGGPVVEGSVGAGTGTQCFGWKGGIGTASRVLPARYGGHTWACSSRPTSAASSPWTGCRWAAPSGATRSGPGSRRAGGHPARPGAPA